MWHIIGARCQSNDETYARINEFTQETLIGFSRFSGFLKSFLRKKVQNFENKIKILPSLMSKTTKFAFFKAETRMMRGQINEFTRGNSIGFSRFLRTLKQYLRVRK